MPAPVQLMEVCAVTDCSKQSRGGLRPRLALWGHSWVTSKRILTTSLLLKEMAQQDGFECQPTITHAF